MDDKQQRDKYLTNMKSKEFKEEKKHYVYVCMFLNNIKKKDKF